MHSPSSHDRAADGERSPGAPGLRVALLSGGDERLVVDPRTGRNRYGVPAEGAGGEVWFASSTASPLSPHGHAAAAGAFSRLMSGAEPAADWMASIRERLRARFGVAGSEVILTGSGTEAELVVLALAGHLLRRPVTSIVVAPQETGSGVVLAAGGRHFLSSASGAAAVERGMPLAGGIEDVAVEGIDIRADDGAPLPPDAVEDRARRLAGQAVRAGRGVVLHMLDASKTGLASVGRRAAREMAATFGDHVVVVVDACQLRCPAHTIRQHLTAGFLVMLTGSKFIGGPPFAGAVLVPPTLVRRLRGLALPEGLAAYCATNDWPARLRDRFAMPDACAPTNIGLGLRWEAALAEIDRYAAIDPASCAAIAALFAAEVAAAVDAVPGLQRLVPVMVPGRIATIHPVITRGRDGAALCARTLHQGLMTPTAHRAGDARVFHVGQPVAVGPEAALRICLGAPQVSDVAARMGAGLDLPAAMAPLRADLAALIGVWADLREQLDTATPARRTA